MRRPWLYLLLFCAAACGEGEGEDTAGVGGEDGPDTSSGGGTRDASARDGGSQSVVSSGGDGASELCDAIKLQSGRVAPDMLIVLDRSSSMRTREVNRWDPSVSGIKAFTSALDDRVNFGLMAFPGNGGAGGGGGRSCAAGSMEVEIGPMASGAIGARLDQLELVQSTPTAATLDAAREHLIDLPMSNDGATAGRYVVLVTDGAPNCSDPTRGGFGGNDAAAVQASVQAIQRMAQQGVRTYVVGYDTQADAELKSALDMMARAGATGDDEHRAIEDEAGLIAAFQAIAKNVVTCDFRLSAPVDDPSFVKVEVGGKLVRHDHPDGWVLGADGRSLKLQGAACTSLEKTPNQTVSVEVQCEPVQFL